jgi:hypothetical protein
MCRDNDSITAASDINSGGFFFSCTTGQCAVCVCMCGCCWGGLGGGGGGWTEKLLLSL